MRGVKLGPSVSKVGLVTKLWLFLIIFFLLSLSLKISSPPIPQINFEKVPKKFQWGNENIFDVS